MVWREGRKKRSARTDEETRIQKKNEERIRILLDIFKHSNIQIIGVLEAEDEEQ